MHPVMQISKIIEREERLTSLPENIQISHEMISMDFDRCRWALYRGSGAAIHAVSAALRPFYIKSFDEELCIDPLHTMETWKRKVKTADDLKAYINADLQCDDELLEREWLPARNFCLEFFSPINIEKFCHSVVDEKKLNK
jgi:hypothetical protein